MDLTRYDKEDLEAALEVLRNGGIIVYPTDTVWGHWLRRDQRGRCAPYIRAQAARRQQVNAGAAGFSSQIGLLCGCAGDGGDVT